MRWIFFSVVIIILAILIVVAIGLIGVVAAGFGVFFILMVVAAIPCWIIIGIKQIFVQTRNNHNDRRTNESGV